MSGERLDVSISTHSRGDHHWLKVTCYSINGGRYGSDLVVTHVLEEEQLPKDAEQLISLLLDSLHGLVYHT